MKKTVAPCDEAGRQVPGGLASKLPLGPPESLGSHFLLRMAWWRCSHVGPMPVLEG